MFRSLPRLFALKKTTGITGLPVVPEARKVLERLYIKQLEDVKSIPADAAYRIDVEKTALHRLAAVQSDASSEEVERVIGRGQLEELITQAESELELIPKMAEWKLWDVPAGHEIQVEVEQPGQENWVQDLHRIIHEEQAAAEAAAEAAEAKK